MIRIAKPTSQDIQALTALAKKTFIESHGHSAPESDIKNYLSNHYTIAKFEEELADLKNNYHLLFINEELAGFSKIIFNQPIAAVSDDKITKLERIYILEKFHGQKLGLSLFNFNCELAKANQQKGIWLFTWIENKRAINFYEKLGFVVVGDHNFKVSETHSNPNWQYYLAF
tara:strand:- start:729 stop:1244 length:516 start_codon:yes stop_codon:yes gene_type:complete